MDREIEAKFEDVLRKRKVPRMPDGLEQHIIATAARSSQSAGEETSRKGFFGSLADFFDDFFVVPKPALSLAVVMIIGAGVGLYSTDVQNIYSDEVGDIMEAYVLMKDDTQLGAEL